MATKITPSGLQTVKDETFEAPKKSKAQLSCEAKGGRWDAANNACIMPTETKPEPDKPNQLTVPVEDKPLILRDKEGNVTGIRRPGDETPILGNPDDIEQILKNYNERDINTEGAVEGTEVAAAAQVRASQQELQTTQQPVRRELDPTLQTGEDIPVVGPLLTKIRKTLGPSDASNSVLDLITGKVKEDIPVVGPLLTKIRKTLGLSAASNSVLDLITGKPKDEEFFELQPEELRRVALTEIERREIERGLTDSEKFGSLIEALPIGELQKYVPGAGAAEKPSENVQTVLKSLRILKSRAIDVELKYAKGTITTRSAANARLDAIENEIQEGESRMKLLIQNSPEFKFNSDGVNFIELKILEARERSFDSRIAILAGPITDPSDIDILMELQAGIQTEDFDIPRL